MVLRSCFVVLRMKRNSCRNCDLAIYGGECDDNNTLYCNGKNTCRHRTSSASVVCAFSHLHAMVVFSIYYMSEVRAASAPRAGRRASPSRRRRDSRARVPLFVCYFSISGTVSFVVLAVLLVNI